MAFSLARILNSKLTISRIVLKPSVNVCFFQNAGKKTIAEELGLPPPPKRPLSAYLSWQLEFRSGLVRKHPNLTVTEIAKKLGETWNLSTPEQKKHWMDLYQRDKEEYDRLYSQYLKKLTPEQLAEIKRLQKKRTVEKTNQKIKRNKKKDMEELGKPKYPGNSFTLFMLDQDRGEARSQEFLQGVAIRWKQLPEDEQKYYKDKALQLGSLYRKNLEAWEAKMIKAGRSDLVRKSQQMENLKGSLKKSTRSKSE